MFFKAQIAGGYICCTFEILSHRACIFPCRIWGNSHFWRYLYDLHGYQMPWRKSSHTKAIRCGKSTDAQRLEAVLMMVSRCLARSCTDRKMEANGVTSTAGRWRRVDLRQFVLKYDFKKNHEICCRQRFKMFQYKYMFHPSCERNLNISQQFYWHFLCVKTGFRYQHTKSYVSWMQQIANQNIIQNHPKRAVDFTVNSDDSGSVR